MVAHFNSISSAVATSIVNERAIKRRVKIMEKHITIAMVYSLILFLFLFLFLSIFFIFIYLFWFFYVYFLILLFDIFILIVFAVVEKVEWFLFIASLHLCHKLVGRDSSQVHHREDIQPARSRMKRKEGPGRRERGGCSKCRHSNRIIESRRIGGAHEDGELLQKLQTSSKRGQAALCSSHVSIYPHLSPHLPPSLLTSLYLLWPSCSISIKY